MGRNRVCHLPAFGVGGTKSLWRSATIVCLLERWMSGLSHTPGKRAWGKTHRGFESRLLRQYKVLQLAQQAQRQPQALQQQGFLLWAPECDLWRRVRCRHKPGLFQSRWLQLWPVMQCFLDRPTLGSVHASRWPSGREDDRSKQSLARGNFSMFGRSCAMRLHAIRTTSAHCAKICLNPEGYRRRPNCLITCDHARMATT